MHLCEPKRDVTFMVEEKGRRVVKDQIDKSLVSEAAASQEVMENSIVIR